MTISLSASPSPSRKLTQQQGKNRKTRRKKKSSIAESMSDRQKHPRNSPPIQSTSEQLQDSQSASPPSEFIKFLPVDALIRYLDHHYLLKSPIHSNPTSPPCAESKKMRNQLINDYHRFALLVSSNLDHPKSAHKSSLPGPDGEAQSPSNSSSSSKSELAFGTSSTSSSASFYERLFSSSADLLRDPDHHQPQGEGDPKKKAKPEQGQTNSLYKFDQTLLNLVLNHHHRSFPTVIVKPKDESISPDKCSPVRDAIHCSNFPSSPCSSSPSSAMNYKDHVQRDRGTEQRVARGEEMMKDKDRDAPTTTTRHPNGQSIKANLMTQHGFVCKIHISDPQPGHHHYLANNSVTPADRQLEILENHVLSNFVYSVKTRGNALRPK